jgi:uncharacterized membrane protein
MRNRNVGWLIVGISVFIFIIIAIFNFGLKQIVSTTCTHGTSCSMYQTISIQTWISIAIAMVVFMIGLFFIISKENERIIFKKIRPEMSLKFAKFDKKSLKKLDVEKRKIMQLILDNNNSIFQSELVSKSGFSKVRITRILDGLESQGLIERKRRGMTNVVMIRQK